VSGLAFREYKFTGAFGRLVGFWAACIQGCYLGIEIIGIVAEETERPRATIPHSVRRVAYRGLIYHVGAVFVLGLNVSANDPILKIIATQEYASPFALMVQRAGIPILAHIINGVSVVALLGVANTRLYVSVITLFIKLTLIQSRTLQALANEGQAPRIFAKQTKRWKIPIYSVGFSSLPALLAFMCAKLPSNTVRYH